jgi:hypothetical protein
MFRLAAAPVMPALRLVNQWLTDIDSGRGFLPRAEALNKSALP